MNPFGSQMKHESPNLRHLHIRSTNEKGYFEMRQKFARNQILQIRIRVLSTSIREKRHGSQAIAGNVNKCSKKMTFSYASLVRVKEGRRNSEDAFFCNLPVLELLVYFEP